MNASQGETIAAPSATIARHKIASSSLWRAILCDLKQFH
jgi:hypothetical protein